MIPRLIPKWARLNYRSNNSYATGTKIIYIARVLHAHYNNAVAVKFILSRVNNLSLAGAFRTLELFEEDYDN